MNISEQRLQRIRQVLGIQEGRGSEQALAKALGVTKGALSNWKARDSLPFSVCEHIARNHARSLDWVMTGHEAVNERQAQYHDEDRIALMKEWMDEVAIKGTIKDRHWLERQFELAFPAFLLWLEDRRNRPK